MAFDTQNGPGDELACLCWLEAVLREFSPDQLFLERVSRSRGKSESGYVLAVWGQPKILLNVHIDTVPVAAGWQTDPFKLTAKGNNLHGLGSSDIKGAAACILAALQAQVPYDVAILFSGDEELGSEVMPEVIARGHLGGIPLAIVCEPTICQVGCRHRGILAFSADFHGQGGHSSLADQRSAPLLQAARLASAIGEYGHRHMNFGTPPYQGLCTNIGYIESDGAYNVIPTHVQMKFSMRPPPADQVDKREGDIREIHARVSPDARLDRLVGLMPFTCRDITALAPYFQDTPVVDLPYWTEAALLSEAGLNVIVYGPGDVEQAHRPNEYVPKVQLVRASELYQRTLSGHV